MINQEIIELARKVSQLSKFYLYPQLENDKKEVTRWLKAANPEMAKWRLKKMIKKLEWVSTLY